jgi:hypothetical protein
MACKKCGNKGFYLNDKGIAVICPCLHKAKQLEYIKLFRGFITTSAINASPVRLMNKSQALVKNDKNMLGIIQLALDSWFPACSYGITSMQECNSIGFNRHGRYRSILDLAMSNVNFILDCSVHNKLRQKHDGFVENDSLYALEFINEVNKDGRICIIVLPSVHTKQFLLRYRDFIDGLIQMGIEYFDNGKYQPFVLLD